MMLAPCPHRPHQALGLGGILGACTVPVSSEGGRTHGETAIRASGMTRSIWSTLSMLLATRRLADQITWPAALLA
jgi:hypothetical protein